MIRLDQFLKLMGAVSTGGQAKYRVQNEEVKVNGVIETRRGRQLAPEDQVEIDGVTFTVDLSESERTPKSDDHQDP